MSPERYARIREVLRQRQTDLTVCMEEVHKPHNVAAIVRSCDAVGIHNVNVIWDEANRFKAGPAVGAQKWVKHQQHPDIESAVAQFKQDNMQVLVTHLSDDAVDYREVDYTKPTAIILGQEKYGATEQAIALADQNIIIPMVGMVQSLNVSVAAALVLYEAQRQRQLAGCYEKQTLPESVCQRILFEGGYPILQKMCVRKQIPYPEIGPEGEIIATPEWWQKMQLTPEAAAQLDD